MAARDAYTRLLTDAELRGRLERKETIVFKELLQDWQQIERQVEHLGFGESYIVTLRNGPRGCTIRVSPTE
jgi:hypothetical protein